MWRLERPKARLTSASELTILHSVLKSRLHSAVVLNFFGMAGQHSLDLRIRLSSTLAIFTSHHTHYHHITKPIYTVRMSKYDRRRVNGPSSYVPVYEASGSNSTASSSTPMATTSQQRPDNRSYSELRPIFLQTNLVPSASGSSYVEIGDLKLACSVFGPRQVKGRQYSGKAELNVEVKFAPFSSRRRRTPGKVSTFFVLHPSPTSANDPY